MRHETRVETYFKSESAIIEDNCLKNRQMLLMYYGSNKISFKGDRNSYFHAKNHPVIVNSFQELTVARQTENAILNILT